MELHVILTIAIAGSMAVLFVVRALDALHHHLFAALIRRVYVHMVYPRVFKTKHKTVLNPTRMEAAYYITHIAIAVLCNVYGITSLAAGAVRAGQLSTAYLVPLVAVRQVHWAASLLGLKLGTFKVFHKSVGTMAALQATLHSVLALQAADWKLTDTIYGLVCFITIGLLAILPWVRRLAYELFLRSHLVLTIALSIFLWEHLRLKSRLSRFMLAAGTVAMATTTVIEWLMQVCTNIKLTRSGLHMIRIGETSHYNGVTLLRLDLARPLIFKPGQYVLLTIISLRHGSAWQRHPFTIIWWDSLQDELRPQAIWLAVREQSGWTSRLARSHGQFLHCPVWIQGPYGDPPKLARYGNVLMFASGVDGMVVQLPLLKSLIEQCADSNAKTRKVKVVWQIKQWSVMLETWLTELLNQSSAINGVKTKELLEFSLHHNGKLGLSDQLQKMIKDYERSLPTTERERGVGNLGQRVRFIESAPDLHKYLEWSLELSSHQTAIIVSAHHHICEAVRLLLHPQSVLFSKPERPGEQADGPALMEYDRQLVLHAKRCRNVLHADFIPLEYQSKELFPRGGGTAV